MSGSNDNSQKKNRYPGIKPFTEEDNDLFFGRKSDRDDLTRRIFIRQTVVLYGKSGYGKSSLINAGIIPNLKKMDTWNYFSIRFNNYSEKETIQTLSPVQTVTKRFSENIEIDKTNAFYKLLPDENSFWFWIKQNQLVQNKTKFIIFFDQFEELFAFSKEDVANFSEQLAELLYGAVPVEYKDKINESIKNGVADDELHKFIYEKPEIKVVFSIRSDRLSLMNILTDRHPTILQYHYELDALKEEDAALAITEPARLKDDTDFKTGPFEYEPLAVKKILTGTANPKDKKVETAALQIVCRYVEDVLVDEKGHKLITEDILGDINEIYKQYYENTLNKFSDQDRFKAQRLIEDELIDGDRRNALTAGYIQNKVHVPLPLLDVLEQSSLLRKEIDASGRLIYEISHDTLLPAINKVAQARRDAEANEKRLEEERKKEQERIEEEQQREEKRALLEKQLEEEKRRSDELKRSNDAVKKSSRNLKFLSIVCICVAVVAGWQAIDAHKQRRKAEEQQRRADTAAMVATKQADTAKRNLYENRLYSADDYINKAEVFMQSKDFPYALADINAADSLVSSMSLKLSVPINKRKQRIRKKIDSLSLKLK